MTWNEYFIQVTLLTAKKSTCIRQQVGCVLVKDRRIISIGYNGTAPGQPHCKDIFEKQYLEKYTDKYSTIQEYIASKEFYDEHGNFSKLKELHSELNCLAFSAKNGNSTDGCELFVSLSPCIACAKFIILAGITKVIYHTLYDRDKDGIEFLNDNKIECKQYIGAL
jgi:dCMP deaminase